MFLVSTSVSFLDFPVSYLRPGLLLYRVALKDTITALKVDDLQLVPLDNSFPYYIAYKLILKTC